MLVSYHHQFLFVHIPKTVGTSIRHALAPYCHDAGALWQNRMLKHLGISVNLVFGGYQTYQFRKHSRLQIAKVKLPSDVYEPMFKFCFVRNTWDLLVSNYNYIRNNPRHKRYPVVSKLDFDQFIDFAVSRRIGFQLDLITSPKGEILVDYVGRFERMSADFLDVQRRLSLVAPLAHLNRTLHSDYRSYYDQRLIAKVSRIYAREIETFEFTFDNGVVVERPVLRRAA